MVLQHYFLDQCPGERPRRGRPSCIAHRSCLCRAAADHFYGERSGTVRDPFGHEWLIGHSIEEVTPEEMQRRYTKTLS